MARKTSKAKDDANVIEEPALNGSAPTEDQEKVEELAELQALVDTKIHYLDDLNSAECPIPGFSGKIKFPAIMDLPRYRDYRKIINESPDEDGQMTLAFVTEESGRVVPVWFSVLYYRISLALGELDELVSPPGTDLNDISKLPVNMIAWLSLTVKEWLDNQLTFRVYRR